MLLLIVKPEIFIIFLIILFIFTVFTIYVMANDESITGCVTNKDEYIQFRTVYIIHRSVNEISGLAKGIDVNIAGISFSRGLSLVIVDNNDQFEEELDRKDIKFKTDIAEIISLQPIPGSLSRFIGDDKIRYLFFLETGDIAIVYQN